MIEFVGKRKLRNIASVGFGGSDLQTVYMGSVSREGIFAFQVPIGGAPLIHRGI